MIRFKELDEILANFRVLVKIHLFSETNMICRVFLEKKITL